MAQGFYELLGVSETAPLADIRAAYQKRLAELVRRRRGAQDQGADVSILEGQERSLREAVEVLSDPARRRRYDAMRSASLNGFPADAAALWKHARGALVDPGTAAAVQTVRALTDLPLTGRKAPSPAEEAPTTPGGPAARAQAGSPPRIQAPAPPAAQAGKAQAPAPQPPRAPAAKAPPAPPAAPARPPTVAELAERHGHDGRFLAAVRELRGLSVDDLSRETRISARYLEALEANGFDHLPASTFVRGYLRQVVRVLRIEDEAVVDDYMDLVRRRRG